MMRIARAPFFLIPLCLLPCGCQSPDVSSPEAPGPEPAAHEDTASSFLPETQPAAGALPDPARPTLSTPQRPEDFARWERDPARAKRKSELLGRPLLILFTGLSWSSNAKLLGEEVFLSKSFNRLARENLTLLYLDFPQNPREAPAALQQFKTYYDVRGFPSVLILHPDGSTAYRRTGYVPGKAQDYFRELENAVRQLHGGKAND
ncbi:MAG: thioredoxin family protein [Verrucomicrobia bacterium]|nr:thioredoxin family protein [Verrucomicrobiota bacterium]